MRADDIARGQRLNLIMWSWNRPYRQSPAYVRRPFRKEARRPDPLCVSFTHDRDYEAVRGEARPPVAGRPSRFGQTAWCPPPFAEYEGFEGTEGRYREQPVQPRPVDEFLD